MVSSSITRDSQSGSDHRTGASGSGEFIAPVVLADRDGENLGPREALESNPRGVAGIDQFGY